jgi:hypothetical protein
LVGTVSRQIASYARPGATRIDLSNVGIGPTKGGSLPTNTKHCAWLRFGTCRACVALYTTETR